MKTILLFFSILLIQNVAAQNITFGDVDLKSKLLAFDPYSTVTLDLSGQNVPLDSNDDNEISISEALTVSYIAINGNQISSLDGLEFFTNLKTLFVDINNVESFNYSSLQNLENLTIGNIFYQQNPSQTPGSLNFLDLSTNLNLKTLFVQTGSLTNLDLSNNVNLIELYIVQEFSNFDANLNNLNNLRKLFYISNLSTSLDISACENLLYLYIFGSGFSSIDVSNQPILSRFEASNTNITSLDLSNNPNLDVVYAGNNQIANLNLGDINYISTLYLQNNNLTSLNASNLNYLNFFDCSGNELTELFILNNSLESYINLENNPNLTYVCCDGAQIIPVQNILNNAGIFNVTVNSDCFNTGILATNDFENNKSKIVLYPNPASNNVSIKSNSEINKIEIYDINNRKILGNSISNFINIENLTSGIYFVKVYTENNSELLKLIKK